MAKKLFRRETPKTPRFVEKIFSATLGCARRVVSAKFGG
jgi:hypothetical protein